MHPTCATETVIQASLFIKASATNASSTLHSLLRVSTIHHISQACTISSTMHFIPYVRQPCTSQTSLSLFPYTIAAPPMTSSSRKSYPRIAPIKENQRHYPCFFRHPPTEPSTQPSMPSSPCQQQRTIIQTAPRSHHKPPLQLLIPLMSKPPWCQAPATLIISTSVT